MTTTDFRIRNVLVIDPDAELGVPVGLDLAAAGIRVIATVGYGLEALEVAFKEHPDMTLIRTMSPLARPLQIIRSIHDALPDSPILAVIDDSIRKSWTKVISAGATVCIEDLSRPGILQRGLDVSFQYFEGRRRGVREHAVSGRVIAVLGAKGGVGKTTVATNLAIALQRESLGSVALVDADPSFGDVALAMNIDASRSLALAAANLSGNRLEGIQAQMSEQSGISILSCGSTPGVQEITPEGLVAVLDELRNAFDFVVVDTSGAWSDVTGAVIDAASTRLLVTTPEPNSVRNTLHALATLRERLGEAAGHVHLVENRAGMDGALDDRQFEQEVGQVPRWRVANDPMVRRGMQVGIPAIELDSSTPGARDLRKIAISLLGRNPSSASQSSGAVPSVSAVRGIA